MPTAHSITKNEIPDPSQITVSGSLHLMLVEQQRELGFKDLNGLIRHLHCVSDDINNLVKYPGLLSVCEQINVTYDKILSEIREG